VLLGTVALLYSCSTKRSGFTHRFYHNMTSRYNAYFNGNESLKEGVAALSKAHVDNYNKVLPVYKLGDAAAAQTVAPSMDRAFTKASIVIQRHSIFIKKKEYCNWIDDSYMMMGKANFYKREYKTAGETFDYVLKKFNANPIKFDAMLWIAKTYNQQGKYDKAQAILDMMQSKMDRKPLPKKVEKEFPMVYADNYILQMNYGPAIEYLVSALKLNKKKKIKTRLSFILAQIYQHTGNLQKATEMYQKVIRMNPPYEMAFNSKINIAQCYDVESGDSKLIKKQLMKMTKDAKNKEYLDQIYYALAEISLKEEDTTTTLKYLQLSARKSVSNNTQKAKSYLKLADLNFYMIPPKYEPAEAAYDSAVLVLAKDYPDYDNIINRKTTLTKLVKNLKVIELEDSLQDLAKKTPKERDAIIDKVIADIIKEEQRKMQEEMDRQQSLAILAQNNQTQNNNNNGSQWYFYNSSAISFGHTEFVKRWGSRKLEDNWRLSNKQVVIDFNEGNEVSGDSLAIDSLKNAKPANLKDRSYYMKNIPLTPEMLAKSNKRIADALFNIGYIYKEDLLNLEKSNETFESLLKRYPDNENALNVYYQLYDNYTDLNDQAKADYYKNLITSKYPDSDYAKILLDPEYYKQLENKKDEAAVFYQDTYIKYLDKQYDTVIVYANRALTTVKDKDLLSKFDYLKALSIGNTKKDTTVFLASLTNVVTRYPTSDVKPLAQNIIDRLTKKSKLTDDNNPDSLVSKDNMAYKLNPDATHFYVIVVQIKNVNINTLKNQISDFDTQYFGLIKLNISNVYLDDKRQMITVSNFENKKKAMEYFSSLKANATFLPNLKPSDYKHFLISVENYTTFFKNKDVDKYLLFFNKNYKN